MLIGLHGRAGAGKDTIAQHLRDKHNYGTLAFATPVKDMLIALGVPRANLMDGALKEQTIDWLGQSPRQLMQTLGTQWGRGLVDDEIWLRHAGRRLQYLRRVGPVCITDVRYLNEAQWVRAQGGRIWHVLRDGRITSYANHSSESPLPIEDDDRTLINNGTVEQLLDLVDRHLAWTDA